MKKPHHSADSTARRDRPRNWLQQTTALFASAVLITTVALAAAGGPRIQAITLVLREYSLTPTTITLRARTPVKLVIANEGARDHEFLVYPVPRVAPRDWNAYAMTHTYFKDMGEIDVALPGQAEIGTTALFKLHVAPGARVTIWFTPRAKGVFEMASHDPGGPEQGLRGTVIVR